MRTSEDFRNKNCAKLSSSLQVLKIVISICKFLAVPIVKLNVYALSTDCDSNVRAYVLSRRRRPVCAERSAACLICVLQKVYILSLLIVIPFT